MQSQQEVEQLFALIQKHQRQVFHFSQSPRAKQLIICRWQKSEQHLQTSNKLSGAVLNNDSDDFKNISNGYFKFIVIGDKTLEIKGVNLTKALDCIMLLPNPRKVNMLTAGDNYV